MRCTRTGIESEARWSQKNDTKEAAKKCAAKSLSCCGWHNIIVA
jgi:hypothetical protein